MHTTFAATTATRVSYLDQLAGKGIWLQYYDPTGQRHGIPTYPWRWAPKGLYTRRQLTQLGLRPGGQEPAAQILWRRGKRVAYLYRADLALPKRTATPAQLAALGRALAARCRCTTCGILQPYCLPRSTRQCSDCTDGATP